MKKTLDGLEPDLQCVAFEVQALSVLLHGWATPDVVLRRKSEWPDKLTAFRDAVLKGLRKPDGQRGRKSGRKSHAVPPELVADEARTIASVLAWFTDNANARANRGDLEEWLRGTEIPCPVSVADTTVELKRHFPGPEEEIVPTATHLSSATQSTSSENRSQRIYGITGARLGINAETVKKYVTPKRTLGKPIPDRSEVQRLLASLLLDLSTHQVDIALQAAVLDALLASSYHVLCLYYLVQKARDSKAPVSTAPPPLEPIHRLCSLILKDQPRGNLPFSRTLPPARHTVLPG